LFLGGKRLRDTDAVVGDEADARQQYQRGNCNQRKQQQP